MKRPSRRFHPMFLVPKFSVPGLTAKCKANDFVRVEVGLPADIKAKLEDYSEAFRCSQSFLIRRAVYELVKEVEETGGLPIRPAPEIEPEVL